MCLCGRHEDWSRESQSKNSLPDVDGRLHICRCAWYIWPRIWLESGGRRMMSRVPSRAWREVRSSSSIETTSLVCYTPTCRLLSGANGHIAVLVWLDRVRADDCLGIAMRMRGSRTSPDVSPGFAQIDSHDPRRRSASYHFHFSTES